MMHYGLFAAVNVDCKMDWSLVFGDYIEVHRGTISISKGRSIQLTALYPCRDTGRS
jgi:hypothetical protein